MSDNKAKAQEARDKADAYLDKGNYQDAATWYKTAADHYRRDGNELSAQNMDDEAREAEKLALEEDGFAEYE